MTYTADHISPLAWRGCLNVTAPAVPVEEGKTRYGTSEMDPFIHALLENLLIWKERREQLHLHPHTYQVWQPEQQDRAAQEKVDRPQQVPDSTRLPSRYPTAKALRQAVRSPVSALVPSQRVPAPIATVALPLRLAGQVDIAVGRGLDFAEAERSATFEALERHCAVHQEQPVHRATFHELPGAVDPADFLLPDRADLASLGETWQPYHPALAIDWTPAFSEGKQQQAMIPARLAYFGYHADPKYVQESSSGSALGSTPAEAKLHALLEVIERDSFLMNWYARRPAQALNWPADGRTALLLDAARRQGYELSAFNTTLENGVPSVWVMARQHHDPTRAASLSSAGAHLQPLRALHSALLEVVASIHLLGQHFDPVRAAQLASDPAQVKTAQDHFLLFGDHGYVHHLDFLHTSQPVSLEEAFPTCGSGQTPQEHLDVLVRKLLAIHGDVYFVDQTAPEVRRVGLYCFRALIPGTLPMTFGHAQRRGLRCVRHLEWCSRTHPAARLASAQEWFSPHPFG